MRGWIVWFTTSVGDRSSSGYSDAGTGTIDSPLSPLQVLPPHKPLTMWRARLHSSWVLALRTASVPSLCDDTVGPSVSRSITLPGSVPYDISLSPLGLVRERAAWLSRGLAVQHSATLGLEDPGSLTQGRWHDPPWSTQSHWLQCRVIWLELERVSLNRVAPMMSQGNRCDMVCGSSKSPRRTSAPLSFHRLLKAW